MTAAFEILPPKSPAPALAAGAQAQTRFLEFFAANIRNAHTRRAYAQAAQEFLEGRASAAVASVADVTPPHVAAYIEQLTRTHSAPSAEQRLAAIQHLFDRLVTGHVVAPNPAHSARGPTHRANRGKTPVRDASEARGALRAFDCVSTVGLLLKSTDLSYAMSEYQPVRLLENQRIYCRKFFPRIGTVAVAMGRTARLSTPLPRREAGSAAQRAQA